MKVGLRDYLIFWASLASFSRFRISLLSLKKKDNWFGMPLTSGNTFENITIIMSTNKCGLVNTLGDHAESIFVKRFIK